MKSGLHGWRCEGILSHSDNSESSMAQAAIIPRTSQVFARSWIACEIFRMECGIFSDLHGYIFLTNSSYGSLLWPLAIMVT